MKLVSLQDALEAFLERPTSARFVTARELVVADAEYAPRSSTLVELTEMLNDQQHVELLQRVEQLLPAWSLCPRLHYLAGAAAEAIGDFEEVELCRFLTQSCLQGLRKSGEGTRRNPWLATYPSDARDCLASFGRTPVSQRLVEGHDCLLDVVTADDGADYWFEVSEMVAAGGELSLAEVASRP